MRTKQINSNVRRGYAYLLTRSAEAGGDIERRRGECRVFDGSRYLFYQLGKESKRDFKLWHEMTSEGCAQYKVIGSYPEYEIVEAV